MLMKINELFARIKRFARSRDSRRGVAIELAIMVLVITLALSILLTSISLIQNSDKNARKKELTLHTELDQIGDAFFAEAKKGTQDFSTFDSDESYECDANFDSQSNSYTLTVKEKAEEGETGKTLLTVVLEKDASGKITVKKWAYN